MLFKKKDGSAPLPSRIESPQQFSAPQKQDSGELDRALEALAGVVRTVGRYALDAPETSASRIVQLAEDWAQHVLIQRARPGDTKPSKGRDYQGVVHFVDEHRKAQHDFVLTSLNDLRETVWAFIHSLNRALSDDGASDVQVSEQLGRLRRAAEHGSTEELRAAAVSTATSIGVIVDTRRKRQAERNSELGKRLASLGRQLEDARRKSETDPLTQLYNRGALDAYLQHLIELQPFVEQASSLLLVDVDHFKKINDSFGHPAGDDVLKRLAECLVRTFLRKNDFVARYGGEEFAVVLPETSSKDGTMLAERLRTALRKIEFPSVNKTPVTVSIGVATLLGNEDVPGWLARADRALYDAKHSGRDRVVCSAPAAPTAAVGG